MQNVAWHTLETEDALRNIGSGAAGLSKTEAQARLRAHGPNRLPAPKTKGWLSIFIDQFKSPLIYVLIAADVTVFFLREFTDGFIVLFILLFNAILGTIQEGRAQNTLAALSKFVATHAEVIRDGKEIEIDDGEIVPGDIILLQEGERIPADARLIEARNLKTDEAALTGESEPVRKQTDPIPRTDAGTSDQRNMVFKGTMVAAGAGKAVVVATGLATVIGKISAAITEINTEIPLTKNLRDLARTVVFIVMGLVIILFAIGVIEGKDAKEMFVASVAIAVAAVPEGLPLVLTVTLAMGVWRMAKRRVVVKKLQAVEALGQAREIAVDKTGTITKNELVIQHVIAGGSEYAIQGIGYDPTPLIQNPSPELLLMGKIGAFCSNARVTHDGGYHVLGDPTEGAMAVFAAKIGTPQESLKTEYAIVSDWPFDYHRKIHATIYKKNDQQFMAVTGAPEVILSLAKTHRSNGTITPLTDAARAAITARFLALSGDGLRVIACAYAENPPQGSDPDHLPPLVFAGLFAMRDGLRPDIQESVRRAREAGIRVIMITGDHAVTAKTIARQAGIWAEGDGVLTGEEIDALAPAERNEKISRATVFARVTPEHKMSIIREYQARGGVIAMTGDGVNDAPSLVAADLGIAMGRIGTEVTKEASDLILLDDNFADILGAVEEGRNMRQGLRRAITYLFSSNLGEILLISFAILGEHVLPLIAAQIIWINVVTDTFFDISIALEPKDASVMKKNFHALWASAL